MKRLRYLVRINKDPDSKTIGSSPPSSSGFSTRSGASAEPLVVASDLMRGPFPGEPIRTLDALHLASALVARAAVADLAFLSQDEKVRASARALGLRVPARTTTCCC